MGIRVQEGCKGCDGFRNEDFRKLNKVIKNTITMSMPLTCHTGEMLGWLGLQPASLGLTCSSSASLMKASSYPSISAGSSLIF